MPRLSKPMSEVLAGRVLEIVEQVTAGMLNGLEVRDGIRQRLERMLEHARNEALEEAAKAVEAEVYSLSCDSAVRDCAYAVRSLKRETE